MIKKLSSLTLVCLLLNLTAVNFAYANEKETKESKFVERLKDGVKKLGTGKEARVQIKLKDKGKLKGYISETTDDYFTVVNENTGAVTTVNYSEVKQVKGNNYSTGVKIAIAVGIGFAVVGVILLIVALNN